MIRIDMPMPNSCFECRFRDTVQSGCNAAEEPGFCVFVGLSETEFVEWEDWKKKISSGRDPRCPLRQERKDDSIEGKVINGLKCCSNAYGLECSDCPFRLDNNCVETLSVDALAMLKEQQKLIDEITQRRMDNGAFD